VAFMTNENIINGPTLTKELEEQRVVYGRRLGKNKIIPIIPKIIHKTKKRRSIIINIFNILIRNIPFQFPTSYIV